MPFKINNMEEGKKRKFFGKFLGRVLKDKGRSQRWLALRAGVNSSYLSQIINGISDNPSIDIALRLLVGAKINPTDYAREAGYLPPYDPNALPENLRIAMRRDNWPADVKPYEIEDLATWGIIAESHPELETISPSGYLDLLKEELRGKPAKKVQGLLQGVPSSIQKQCYEVCRAIVNDWRRQEERKEEEESGK